MANLLEPTHSPILSRTFESADACGTASAFDFTVRSDPPSILLATKATEEFHGGDWVYGFNEEARDDERLRLRFASADGNPLVGHCVEVDATGVWIGEPVALREVDGLLVHEFVRPAEDAPEPTFLVSFSAPTTLRSASPISTTAERGVGQEFMEPPIPSAQPKMTVKPKRHCPTGSTSPTTRD